MPRYELVGVNGFMLIIIIIICAQTYKPSKILKNFITLAIQGHFFVYFNSH